MKEQLEERIASLKVEFENGQKMLNDLETKEAELKQTMLRISGAIQVLEELVAGNDSGKGKDEAATKGTKPHPVAEVA